MQCQSLAAILRIGACAGGRQTYLRQPARRLFKGANSGRDNDHHGGTAAFIGHHGCPTAGVGNHHRTTNAGEPRRRAHGNVHHGGT